MVARHPDSFVEQQSCLRPHMLGHLLKRKTRPTDRFGRHAAADLIAGVLTGPVPLGLATPPEINAEHSRGQQLSCRRPITPFLTAPPTLTTGAVGIGVGGWSVVPGHRRGGQGLALYAWSQGDADAVAAPGAKSGVHTHPGTEAFLVLKGQLSQQTPHGVNVVEAGKTLAGGPAEHPMEVTNSGGEELHWLIMFVVDANKPFASEATFE
jgi:hypothetical protein